MTLGFSVDSRAQLKNDELKHRLLELVNTEKTDFLKIAESFYNKGHRNDVDYNEFCESIITTINKILEGGDWNDSLFLRNTVKPLQKMRDEAKQLLQKMNGAQVTAGIKAPQVGADKVAVYISIFQMDGDDLLKWELQLRSIKSYLLGRPVYQNETDVQKVIRAKIAKTSEAYIVVAIDKAAIRNEAHLPPRMDRYKNTLLTLKEGSVTPDNIIEFVHMSKRYCFKNGKLVQQQV